MDLSQQKKNKKSFVIDKVASANLVGKRSPSRKKKMQQRLCTAGGELQAHRLKQGKTEKKVPEEGYGGSNV